MGISINKMKTFLSIIFFASIFNWIEGAPFSKLSSHDARFLSAIHSGEICKNLELQESEHHLIADPDDCKKFFSCQYGLLGWLAYSMSCADGTHFDGVYCVTGDCRSGDLVIKEDPILSTPKYYATTTKSTSISTTTEVATTTKFTTTITTEEEPTTTTTSTTTSTTTTTTNTTSITTTNKPTTTTTTTTNKPTNTTSTTTSTMTTTTTTTTSNLITSTTSSSSSSSIRSSKAVVTPRKFL